MEPDDCGPRPGTGPAEPDGWGEAIENWVVRAPAGYRIGQWCLTEPIATGSWSSVYAARRTATPPHRQADEAAVKLVPGSLLTPAHQATLRAMVRRETRLAAALSRPGLLAVREVHVVLDPARPHLDGVTALVMERARCSLAELLAAAPDGAPLSDAGRLVRDIAAALDQLHAGGWVHADLKPGNVLVKADGSAVLTDFGLAAELDGTHAYTEPLGTPDYLPPEWWSAQATARGVEVRAARDVWAFGVLTHQILTGGRHPFAGATPGARAAGVRAAQQPVSLSPALPEPWQRLVLTCLDPAEQSRAALVGRLARLVDDADSGGAAHPPGPPRGTGALHRVRELEDRLRERGSRPRERRTGRPVRAMLSVGIGMFAAGAITAGAVLALPGRTAGALPRTGTHHLPAPSGSPSTPPGGPAAGRSGVWTPRPLPAAPRLSHPVNATGESAVALLLDLLPDPGHTSNYAGHSTDGQVQGQLDLEDGHGPARVGVDVHPPRSDGTPQRCADLSGLMSIRVIDCADHRLPGGGWVETRQLDLTGNGADPNDRGKIQYMVRLVRPDRVTVEAYSCNGPCSGLGPADRPLPPLTVQQLYAIASDSRWGTRMERDFVREAERKVTLESRGSF